jgi:VWFA-related protein
MKPMLWLLVGSLSALPTPAPEQVRPRFVTSVDAVGIDVLVTDDGRPVRGLGAGDFRLLDNGIEQTIRVVDAENLPLTVSVVLDVSDSVAGPTLDVLQSAARALIRKLAPSDQVNVLTVADSITLIADTAAPIAERDDGLAGLVGAGGTRLFDAIWTALQLAAVSRAPRHRTVIVVFSDARDTTSWLGADVIRDLLDRTEAVVFGVVPSVAVPAASTSPWDRAAHLPDDKFLTSLTDASGGRLLLLKPTDDLSRTFESIIADMRSRYVLYYQPAGVDRAGAHKVRVTLTRRQGHVQARPMYVLP